MGKRKGRAAAAQDDKMRQRQRHMRYEVDFIVARKLVDGLAHYLMRWKGYDEKGDTWEPLTNLAGIEPDVAAFEAKKEEKGGYQLRRGYASSSCRCSCQGNRNRSHEVALLVISLSEEC